MSPEEGPGPGRIEVRGLALGERQRPEDILDRGPHDGRSVRRKEHLAGLVRGHRLQHCLEGRPLDRAGVFRLIGLLVPEEPEPERGRA